MICLQLLPGDTGLRCTGSAIHKLLKFQQYRIGRLGQDVAWRGKWDKMSQPSSDTSANEADSLRAMQEAYQSLIAI
jgi:hypothetical protein